MTLELRLRRFSFLPSFMQTGNGEPRKAHIVGKNAPSTVGKPDPGHRSDQSPNEQEPDSYRPLTSIRLKEVDAALRHFMLQLVPSPIEGWIARNYFCQLPVRQETRHQSPVVFGRVGTSYPSDGQVQNVRQLELYLPSTQKEPDLLSIHRSDLLLQEQAYSYCVGVRMYLSASEMEDFRRSENIFVEQGFAPLYESGYLDLLDVNEQNHDSLFWLNVVGSEWFASIPASVQPEVRQQLRNFADWGNVLLNYHPRRHSLRYVSLNEELDFQYGFTRHFLIAPQDTSQVLQKVDEIFGKIFMQAMH